MILGFKEVSWLSWNIWGALNNKAKRHLIEIIQKSSPTILIIMETHGAFDKTLLFWRKVGYSKVVVVEARGQFGGIWFLK